MSGDDAASRSGSDGPSSDSNTDNAESDDVVEELSAIRDRLDTLERDLERRSVSKPSLEGELKRYVRRRLRRGHARGWGPYLVLLYGTAMTIAAFYFLSGGWAILAMIVIWTSTLGVYFLMLMIGTGLSILNVPGRLFDRIPRWRS